jgi:hypothetical protein
VSKNTQQVLNRIILKFHCHSSFAQVENRILNRHDILPLQYSLNLLLLAPRKERTLLVKVFWCSCQVILLRLIFCRILFNLAFFERLYLLLLGSYTDSLSPPVNRQG